VTERAARAGHEDPVRTGVDVGAGPRAGLVQAVRRVADLAQIGVALVVAMAGAPASSIRRADIASQAFGRTSTPWCSCRKRAASLIVLDDVSVVMGLCDHDCAPALSRFPDSTVRAT
jgi:hypothetical protein